MASAEQLPSGRWRPIARDHTGKKIPKLGTYALKREALFWGNKAEVEARSRAPGKNRIAATIKWGTWWDTIAGDRDYPSDTEEKQGRVAEIHLRPVWGETGLNEISGPDIQKWVNGWSRKRKPDGKPYSVHYIRTVYGVFSWSINKAIDQEILDASPLTRIKLPKVKKRVSKRFISDDDEPKITATLNKHNARAVEFGRLTGTRPGELAGIHADQIDRKRMRLIIRTVYVPGKKIMRDWPKDGDERVVPLTTRALQLIDEAIADRDMTQPCGIPHFDRDCPGDVVFRTQRGRVFIPDTLQTAMAKAAQRTGTPKRSPYDGRRGYATRLREAGEHPFTIMELMGHETVEESHGYSQQGDDVPRSVRAALGDTAVAGLSVVGRDEPRGTARGTDLSGSTRDENGTRTRRRAR